jgi:hypothetical protein
MLRESQKNLNIIKTEEMQKVSSKDIQYKLGLEKEMKIESEKMTVNTSIDFLKKKISK